MPMIMKSNAAAVSSSPCLLLIALLLASAASTGHAQDLSPTLIQEVRVSGQVPCNGGSSDGAAGVNVTLSCGQGTNLTDMANSITDQIGSFNITVENSTLNGDLFPDIIAGRCIVYTTLPILDCPNFAPTGFLVAHVVVEGIVGVALESLISPFSCLLFLNLGI
ncbi:hypothetical protein S245_020661 [Arachis hypogaea]|nr:uncharacterized protein DS421_6g190460 [Arachis hypogaea]